jgi:hypothetical protein
LKAQEKNDTHVSFDDESAFLSLDFNVQLSTFNPDSNEVYFETGMSDINDISHAHGYHSHVAFPSTAFNRYERTIIDHNDNSFLRLPNRYIDTMVDDEPEPIYETTHFSDISNKFEHISGLIYHQYENAFEPIALVAQVSYDNGDDTISWVIDNGSTHHMNGFAYEFLTVALEEYDDGLLIKGLVSGTTAYGNG